MGKLKFIPPNGGYGWVVALAGCWIRVFSVGFFKSFGFVYVHLSAANPNASAYELSLIPSILGLTGQFIAPITGVLCQKFGCRPIALTGGILCFLGFFLASFTSSIPVLIITIGLIESIGIGISIFAGLMLCSQYFTSRRGKATAICISGNAIGGFLMPPIITGLVYAYGIHGCLLVLSGLMLQVFFGGALLRPPAVHAIIASKKLKNRSFLDLAESNNVSCNKKKDLECSDSHSDYECKSAHNEDIQEMCDKNDKISEETTDKKHKKDKLHKIIFESLSKQFINKEIMTDTGFILLCLSVACISLTIPHAMIYLPVYTESVNIDTSTIAYIVSISSIVDLLARLGTGVFTDCKIISLTGQFIICEVITLIGIVIIPFVKSYAGIAIAVCIHNFGLGSWFVTLPLLLSNNYGPETFGFTYGIMKMVQGIVSFISPQISGLLIDTLGDVTYVFYFMSGAAVCAVLFMSLIPLINKCNNSTATTVKITDGDE